MLKMQVDSLQIHSSSLCLCYTAFSQPVMYKSVYVRINKFHVAYTPFYPPITEDTCLTMYFSRTCGP